MKTLTGICIAAVLLLVTFRVFPQEKEKYPLTELQIKSIQNQVLRLVIAQDKVSAAQAEFNAVNQQVLNEMHATEKANNWPDNLQLLSEDPITKRQLLPDIIKLVDPPAPPSAANPEPKKDEKPAPAPAPPAPAAKPQEKKP
jgi:hypothetical protein